MTVRDEKHIRVLLVEDDPDAGKFLKKLLEQSDMTVTLASDGEQALRMLSDEALSELDPDSFDIVVSDVRLEGMSGTDLLKKIRGKAPDLPVILITAYSNFDSAMEAVKYDAQDFIFKRPDTIGDLALPIKKAVHNYRLLLKNRALTRELEKSRSRFRDLSGLLPEGVLETDGNGKITFLSHAGRQKFGLSEEDVDGGLTFEQCLVPEDRGKLNGILQRLLKGDLPPKCEMTALRKDGGTFAILLLVAPIIQEERAVGMRGIAIDITEIKTKEIELQAYQDRLRFLVNELTISEERERRDIARDLHDSLAQLLALSKEKLSAIAERSSGDMPDLKTTLNGIRTMVARALEQARMLTQQLCPPALYEEGLEKALEDLVEEVKKANGIAIVFEEDHQPKPLEVNQEILLFRSVQELLRNIVGHARANQAAVRVRREENEIVIEVEDNGVGFDPQACQATGIGLFSIHERLRSVGGGLRIQSEPGRGAHVTMRSPLRRL